jgi:chorismate dehydratase
MQPSLRVGIVDYLNSRPLAWDLSSGRAHDGLEAVYLSPAEIADRLAGGDLEVGLLPTIELQNIPELAVIRGPCVAAQRAVRSVLLVAEVAPSEIRRVAVDMNSRTSVALVKILLAERYGVWPEYFARPPDLHQMLSEADAALVIGDAALAIPPDRKGVYDLAVEWRQLTGLPFVFAVWAVRPEAAGSGVAALLRRSLEHGLANLETIAAQGAEELGLALEEVRSYLTESLSFDLGPQERLGLKEFYRRVEAAGLLSPIRPLRFLD